MTSFSSGKISYLVHCSFIAGVFLWYVLLESIMINGLCQFFSLVARILECINSIIFILVLLMLSMKLRTQEMLKNMYQIKLISSAKSHTYTLPLSDKLVHISSLPIFVLKILEIS